MDNTTLPLIHVGQQFFARDVVKAAAQKAGRIAVEDHPPIAVVRSGGGAMGHGIGKQHRIAGLQMHFFHTDLIAGGLIAAVYLPG